MLQEDRRGPTHRKSQRTSRPLEKILLWFISSKHRQWPIAIHSYDESTSYFDAKDNSHWINVINNEINNPEYNGTWKIISTFEKEHYKV